MSTRSYRPGPRALAVAATVLLAFGFGTAGYVDLATASSVETVDGADSNVFPPIAKPPVVLLVGSGILALGLLGLLRLRDVSVGLGASDDPRAEPWESDTDAGRVRRLLADNDGYMKQSRIVEETDWSKAKVSRLLSRMEEEDQIRKNKDGRENVIALRER